MLIKFYQCYFNLELQPLSSCKDMLSSCPSQINYCFKGYTFSSGAVAGLKIEDACPLTCKKCTRTALSCATSSSLCLNGATCNDINALPNYPFGFTCSCATGYSGQFCQTGTEF